MAKIFRRGEKIDTFEQLLEARTDGSGYVFWHDRPLAIGFIGNMTVDTVRKGLYLGVVHRAVRKEPVNP